MTPQQIVGLASRLLAIWTGIQAVQVINMLEAIPDLAKLNPDWRFYLLPLIYAAAALILWFFPLAIAHTLIPRTQFNDKLRLPAEKVVAVACVVLGLVVIFYTTLPLVTRYVLLMAVFISEGHPLNEMGWATHVRGIESLVQWLAGLFLILKPHAISTRLIGPPKEAEENKDEHADAAE